MIVSRRARDARAPGGARDGARLRAREDARATGILSGAEIATLSEHSYDRLLRLTPREIERGDALTPEETAVTFETFGAASVSVDIASAERDEGERGAGTWSRDAFEFFERRAFLKESSKRSAMDAARLRRMRIADERAKMRERAREGEARAPGRPRADGAPAEFRKKRGRPRKHDAGLAARERERCGRKRIFDPSAETCAECGTHQTPQWRCLSAQFAVLERADMLNAVVCNRCYARAKRRSYRLIHPRKTKCHKKPEVDVASTPTAADALGALCAAVDM